MLVKMLEVDVALTINSATLFDDASYPTLFPERISSQISCLFKKHSALRSFPLLIFDSLQREVLMSDKTKNLINQHVIFWHASSSLVVITTYS